MRKANDSHARRQQLYASHDGELERDSDSQDAPSTPPRPSLPSATASSPSPSLAVPVEDCVICTDPMLANTIPVRLPCGHSAHRNCLLGVRNKLCPLCRAPIPVELFHHVEVEDDPFEGGEPPLWMYASRDGVTWWYYLPAHSELLEAEYQRVRALRRRPPSAEVVLTVQGKHYAVDVVGFEQRAPDGATHKVKRRERTQEPEGIRGVAGAVPKQSGQ
jgi:Ring finger domain/WWE domain